MDLDALGSRLDGGHSHTVFRAVLDAFSRPGLLVRLDPDDELTGLPVAWPALALADIDVVVHTYHSGDPDVAGRLMSRLERATGARVADHIGEADIVIVVDRIHPDDLGLLRTGDAAAPELGARLLVRCASLDASRDGVATGGTTIWVVGPGAAAGRLVRVGGVDSAVVERLDRINAGYPAGIDVLYVADDGTAVAVPRSCRVEIVAEVA